MCSSFAGSGDVLGVLQIINKSDGPFTLVDEEVCGILTKQAGVCLRNAQAHKAQIDAQRKLRHLTDLVRVVQGGGSGGGTAVNNLVFTIQAKAPAILNADRCVCFVRFVCLFVCLFVRSLCHFFLDAHTTCMGQSVAITIDLCEEDCMRVLLLCKIPRNTHMCYVCVGARYSY
jgi:hypothetical protein